jgi:dihydrofolate reductase
MITIIAATSENNALGKDNELVWHLPDDFKRFKELTSGNYILMGRKTFESFPKPLPNRKHLIITRQEDYKVPENCFAFDRISKALDFIPFTGTIENPTTSVWIIGGGEIYKQSMEMADRIELTKVHSEFDADTFFPEIGEEWELVNEEYHSKDDRHKYDFTYLTYDRKNII